MKFKVERKGIDESQYNIEDLKLARSFATKIYKELGNFCVGLILFGSTVRKDKKKRKGRIGIRKRNTFPVSSQKKQKPNTNKIVTSSILSILVFRNNIGINSRKVGPRISKLPPKLNP